ncbi:hypothetical protein Asru_0930_02 [Acidisphaera rubrifaciens HS-AP3]|uniref:DUF4185 domain-containing protein n=2 Tax=Acidisphaera TaxID=50714 RepID=A0A0D6P9Z3_9PROT|nr:hypothetical protein Asru_0930_02 [Acidisphaera rubrifaciens HS-AP3]
MTVAARPEMVFDADRGGCGPDDQPDAPARAFRDAEGRVHLFASGSTNRSFVGPSLAALKHSCVSAYQGRHRGDPAAFDDFGWLAAFWTEDGRRVTALVHNEFHGWLRPALCPSGDQLACWYNAVTLAQSDDGGVLFGRVPGAAGVVAAPAHRFRNDLHSQSGYFNPSNIVAEGGYFYAFMALIDPISGRWGSCLFRTDDVADGRRWRGWDGTGFTVAAPSPYAAGAEAPAEGGGRLCQPIPNLMFIVGSVQRHVPSGRWVAVMRFNVWDRPTHGEVPGVYAAQSADLLHWSRPVLVLSDAQARTLTGDAEGVQRYPALLDDSTGDRNFATVGDAPRLYTIRTDTGSVFKGHRLIAWPMRLSLPPLAAAPR